MSRDSKKTKLMEQQTAVLSYLEDLLNEIPDNTEADVYDNVVEVFSKQKIAKPKTDTKVKAKISVVNESKPEPTIEAKQGNAEQKTETQELPRSGTDKIQHAEHDTAVEAKAEPAVASQLPDWAELEFQCLLFHVTGITLAVPLIKLNGVIPWNDDITPMPGHSPAFLGILRHLNKNVQVMDAAEVILPDSQRKQILPVAERVKKIILMDEGKWGLACDDIGEVITLQKADVRWRTADGRRAWLAGTVSERLCALLDTDSLTKIFAENEKS